MSIELFSQLEFLPAIKGFFRDLKVPINYVTDEPTTAKEVLKDTYKENDTFQLIADVYFVGMVDDAAFEGNKSLEKEKIKSDYDGILIFGITLIPRLNGLLPTRSQLAEIARAFNREFYYTPVVVVFKYENLLALANTERLKYKQEWREGEKAGKVSLLRDINIEKPHRGHNDILQSLKIPITGNTQVDSFTKLYGHWQEVFNISVLNKKFYQELSNWYFWARNEVKFPNEPMRIDFSSDDRFEEAKNEHNGKNVIRLLTRILFVWFIKEKGLIPNEIFDEAYIENHFLKDFEPQKPQGIFATGKNNSRYYRAILQNMFFATLNCERGKREFRKEGMHQNTTHLMRYKKYFKNPETFLNLMEEFVPFMNGGLFECLDRPHSDKKGRQGGDIIVYQDGFSDKDDNLLMVPDFLFFDKNEEVDLSKAYGQTKYKKTQTKGLIRIFESYKFTITENTPLEEDVALDPELLGKVFENLLASYNPETKTTARKQTGSFYTPREIVNYMVDQSLIKYLKNSISDWEITELDIDKELKKLFSYDIGLAFENNTPIRKKIIEAIDKCNILDPACGSGAFPMGILQKMVHVLHKIDPQNKEWQERQLAKRDQAIRNLEDIEDAVFRDKSITELKEQKKDIIRAFENNELDYARKLFLIENCIYGIDIQSIAIQISKLRFFISLVVDQTIDRSQENFGIRPLPNLETKFVAANSLIGINKPKRGDFHGSLFDDDNVKNLERDLKSINKRIFSIKSPARKRELRDESKAIRERMAELLENEGLENKTARMLASWDPYDQSVSSPFFDSEWMFDITDGFDVIIGNPPYGVSIKDNDRKEVLKHLNKVPDFEIYYFFIDVAFNLLTNNKGILTYIVPNTYLFNVFAERYREDMVKKWEVSSLLDFTNYSLFDAATVRNSVFILCKNGKTKTIKYLPTGNGSLDLSSFMSQKEETIDVQLLKDFGQNWALTFKLPKSSINALAEIKSNSVPLVSFFPEISQGLIAYDKYQGQSEQIISSRAFHFSSYRPGLKKWLWGEDVRKYQVKWNAREYIDYCNGIANPRDPKFFKNKRILIREITNPSIFAAITSDELYFDPSVLVIMDSQHHLEALSMILNSKFGTFYHFNASPKATKGDFPKILVKDIKEFPVPKNFDNINAKFWSNFFQIMTGNDVKYHNLFNSIIDGACFELYFSAHMHEKRISILNKLEQDINKLVGENDFADLTDYQKEEVIEALYLRWSSPDNEILNCIKLFAVRSPDILKPILEG